jgi:hypothetical protein
MRFQRVFLLVSLVAIAFAGILLLNNNANIVRKSRSQFERELDRAITASTAWVIAHGEGTAVPMTESPKALLENAALMHMVAESARMSGDGRLRSLAQRYFSANAKPYSFGRMVDPNSRFEQPGYYSWSAEDYQPWFLHALAPRNYPLRDEALANMFSPDKYRTGGATHQLFALYLYRTHNGDSRDIDQLIHRISLRIASEASIDFRVTDLYLQRVAFLLAAGQPDLVKNRWIERALAAQQPDGGWLYSWHGWHPTPYRVQFGELSTSHPTVQGMWMAYMLKYRYAQWIEKNYR